ncbi:MAG: hypothetical protein ACI31A_08460 [Candidatus Limisoma sp.]
MAKSRQIWQKTSDKMLSDCKKGITFAEPLQPSCALPAHKTKLTK